MLDNCDPNLQTLIVFIIQLAVAIGIFVYQERNSNNLKRERLKNARKDILSTVAIEIAQSNWGDLDLNKIENLIRKRSRELDFNLITDDELTILVQDLRSKILEDHFLSPDYKSELYTRVQKLDVQFRQERPILDMAEFERLSSVPVINWLSIIARFLFYLAITTAAAMVTLLIIVHFTHPAYDVTYVITPYIVGLAYSILRVIQYIREYRLALAGHNRTVDNYEKTVYVAIIKVLHSYNEKAMVRREYQVTMGEKSFILDMVLESKGERFPLEIKYKPTQNDVVIMASSVERLKAKKGIIISYSKADQKIKRFAQLKNVALFDEVINEIDIVQMFRDEGII